MRNMNHASAITFKELISRSFRIYARQFTSILVIILVVYLPVNAVVFGITTLFPVSNNFRMQFDLYRLFEALFGIVATMGVAVVVEKDMSNPKEYKAYWKESLRRAFSRWASAVGTNILAGIIIVFFTLLLIIPGVIWSLYYAFIIQVVVLKNLGGDEALDYSKSCVKGQWWRVFWKLSVVGFITIVISLLIGGIANYLPAGFEVLTGTVADIIGAYFTVAVTVYFITIDNSRNGAQPDVPQQNNV